MAKAAASEEKLKEEEASAEEVVAGFLQNHRKPLFAALIVIVAAVAGFIAFYAIRDAVEKKQIARVDEYARELKDAGGAAAASDELLGKISGYAPKCFGYASAKAFSMAGEIYAAKSDWAKAEESWAASAAKAPKIFLAPLSLYNAAAAAEAQGKIDAAIEYHNKALAYAGVNPSAVRSQFSVGRLLEGQGKKSEAVEAYRKVIEKWPENQTWSNLARSRIIVLEG